MPTFYNFVDNAENLVSYSTYNASTWSNIFPANATLTTGISAPDGTNTAVRLTCSTSGSSLLRVSFPGFTPDGIDTYTTSFFVKLISGDTSTSSQLTTDLADGSPSGNYLPSLITDTWVRVSFSGVPTATVKSFIDLLSDNTNNYVLDFWGVQIEKKSSASAYVSTNGNIVPSRTGLTYSFDDYFVPANYFKSGNLWVWGSNFQQRLGVNSGVSLVSTPILQSGVNTWKSVGPFCAIKTDGTLWTWGPNSSKQIGDNTTTSKSTPVTTFAGGNDWKFVTGRVNAKFAIKTDGTLWAWGGGLLGNGQNIEGPGGAIATPITTFIGGNDWKKVACSEFHTVAIKTDGTLWTWGAINPNIGFGNIDTKGIPAVLGKGIGNAGEGVYTPVTTFAGGTNWALSASVDTSTISAEGLAIKSDGTLWTWGNLNSTITYTPVTTLTGGTNWQSVDSNSDFATGIKTDGTLWVWAKNAGGSGIGIRSGTNTTSNSNLNTPVTTFAGGTNWKQVSCSRYVTAAVKTDGTLWLWGDNVFTQLGNATVSQNALTPITTFLGGTNWKQVSVGQYITAAVKTNGTLWTWGRGFFGALGNNNTSDRSTPVTTFSGGTTWNQVSCGIYAMMAVKTDGTLWGCGGGIYIGANTSVDRSIPTTTFVGGTTWKKVSCGYGYNSTMAIKTDGTLWVWGSGSLGILGTNNEVVYSTPVTTFAGGTNWLDISTKKRTSLALRSVGVGLTELVVFGSNFEGDAGIDRNPEIVNNIPAKVATSFINWQDVCVHTYASAAIRGDGTLWAWGSRFYTGTQNSMENVFTPVTIFTGGTNWKNIAMGGDQTLVAVKTDGTLWTWGGPLGTYGDNLDNSQYRVTPITTFAGGNNWKKVFNTISNNPIALKTDGTLWTWGANNNGQMGNTIVSSNDTLTPITTFAGGKNWVDAFGADNTCSSISYIDPQL